MVTRLCTLCSQQPPANGASFYAACLLTYTEAETQRHCIAGYRVLQDTEYCSTAAHSWSEWRASGRNLAVRVPSHNTLHRLGTCHQWGPLLSVVTCVTTRPSPLLWRQTLQTLTSAVSWDLQHAALCSTLNHSAAQHRSAQVHGAQLTARTEQSTVHTLTTVPYCTVLHCTCVERRCVLCLWWTNICTSVRERYKLH